MEKVNFVPCDVELHVYLIASIFWVSLRVKYTRTKTDRTSDLEIESLRH